MTRRAGSFVPVTVLVAGLALTGCSEADREGIVDAVESALDATRSESSTATPTATSEPTVTTAPTTTAEPTTTPAEPTATAAPTPTAEPTATAPSTPAAPTEQASPTTAGEVTSDEGLDPWVWVVLVVGVLLLLWAIVAAFRRRRRARGRVSGLRDTAIAETDWLLSVARERPSAADAVGRARDVRVRLDRLTETLQELRAAAGAELASVAADLQDAARQLADALVARLDDAAEHRRDDEGLGLPGLVDRVVRIRDRLAHARPRAR